MTLYSFRDIRTYDEFNFKIHQDSDSTLVFLNKMENLEL